LPDAQTTFTSKATITLFILALPAKLNKFRKANQPSQEEVFAKGNNSKMNLTELTGQIIRKEPRKVYNKKSPWYGTTNYQLKVLTTDQEKHTFFVYANLVSPVLLETIASRQYVDKRYLFCAEKKKQGFILHSWQELNAKEESHA